MTDRARWAGQYLEYTFDDESLLEQALTHRSASRRNNERLEFLGDSLLNFTIAHRLFSERGGDAEGDLSRARAALVNQSVLAAIARRIRMDEQLILGTGEVRSGGAHRSSALADAVEAVIGAVLVDGGYEAAERLVARLFASELEALPEAGELKDPKTKLQEWLQGRGFSLPKYSVDAIEGKEHKRVFTVVCDVDDVAVRSTGTGSSRRLAEQDAAAQALAELTREGG